MAKKSTDNAITKEFKTQTISKDDPRFERLRSKLRPDLRQKVKRFELIETDDAGNAIRRDEMHKKIPIVECEATESGSQVFFYCRYCKRKHYHGNVGLENGKLGHRGAHCINDESPYLRTGYYLKRSE